MSKNIPSILEILYKTANIFEKEYFFTFAGKMTEIVSCPIHYILMSTKTKQKRKIPENSKIQKLLFPRNFFLKTENLGEEYNSISMKHLGQ